MKARCQACAPLHPGQGRAGQAGRGRQPPAHLADLSCQALLLHPRPLRQHGGAVLLRRLHRLPVALAARPLGACRRGDRVVVWESVRAGELCALLVSRTGSPVCQQRTNQADCLFQSPNCMPHSPITKSGSSSSPSSAPPPPPPPPNAPSLRFLPPPAPAAAPELPPAALPGGGGGGGGGGMWLGHAGTQAMWLAEAAG